MIPWPHQDHGVDETLAAINRGERRVLLTSPTGGGKTDIMLRIAQDFLERGKKVVAYTNRKLLREQMGLSFAFAGQAHGVRASGADEGRHEDFQLASIQTEFSRVKSRGEWQLHQADLVLVDEAHLQMEKMARRIFDAHAKEGAVRVGFTATPLDLGDLYDTLVVAGTTSELRACGALVPCYHYGPDEPDLRGLKAPLGEDLSENQAKKLMMREGLFGRVLENFDAINPDHKPSILFAPGVAESIWFAEQFQAAGIPAAHIDGQEVWIDGKFYKSDRDRRKEVLAGSRSGRITVLCNRFVLREGIDAPWLAHGIFATIFGSLQSYLQSGGRLLRAHPSLDSVTLQDHGGNWWRHGSLNADRQWELTYTSKMISDMREDRLREKQEREPRRCPMCAAIIIGTRCRCGYEFAAGKKVSRPVVQSDGTLKELGGDIFKARRVCTKPNGPELWKRMYFRSRSGKGARSFRAAAALFAMENQYGWPDKSWPLMPTRDVDWYKLVADVPRERLR